MSLAQSFLKPEDPSSKKVSAPGACNLQPTEVAPPMDFKLVRCACDLRVWDRWRHPCAPQGREKMMRLKHLHVHCTCTLHPSPFFIRRQVGLAKVHLCTEFGVASSKFSFTGGPHVKTSSPLARAAGTPQKRHPQWILSCYSMRVTCEFGFSGCLRLTCRGVRIF